MATSIPNTPARQQPKHSFSSFANHPSTPPRVPTQSPAGLSPPEEHALAALVTMQYTDTRRSPIARATSCTSLPSPPPSNPTSEVTSPSHKALPQPQPQPQLQADRLPAISWVPRPSAALLNGRYLAHITHIIRLAPPAAKDPVVHQPPARREALKSTRRLSPSYAAAPYPHSRADWRACVGITERERARPPQPGGLGKRRSSVPAVAPGAARRAILGHGGGGGGRETSRAGVSRGSW